MSRELKGIIAQLEAQRSEILAFRNTLRSEVKAGALTQELADEIFLRQYGTKSYEELVAGISTNLDEANAILRQQRKELAIAVSPGAVVIIVGLALVFSFGGITGLFTFSDETFYQYEIGETTSLGTTIDLPITQNISSLRVNGEISGTGTATVYLVSAGVKYRAAHFDANSPEPSMLTGLFTEDTRSAGIQVVELNGANESNGSIEPDATEIPEETSDLPFGGAVSDTSVQSNQTSDINETNSSQSQTTQEIPPVIPDSENVPPQQEVVVLPSSQPDDSPEEVEVEPRLEELDNECLDTCALPALAPPYRLLVEITGSVAVRIDSVVFGVKPEAESTETPNTASNSSTSNNTTNNSLPFAQACVTDEDCDAALCHKSVYEGVLSAGVCVPSKMYCIANNQEYLPGESSGISSCVASSTRAVWLVRQGEGRFGIQDVNNTTVAVIDKYGTLAVSGYASFNVNPSSSGWIIKDANNTTAISVSQLGLEARGALLERTKPEPTAGGDFIIKDVSGAVRAVLTENGDVQLSGDLISEVDLR